jgi:hypothetical protein
MSNTNPFRFVHEGFRSHQATWLAQQGRLNMVGRGMYVEKDASPDAIQAGIFSAFAYRYPAFRLMGESARRVFEQGLSPCVHQSGGKQVIYASGDVSQKRERTLIDHISVIVRPENGLAGSDGLAGGSPFLLPERHILSLHDGGSTFFYRVSPAQMLLDTVNHPECGVPAREALALLEGLPEAHRDRFLANDAARKAVTGWRNRVEEVIPEDVGMASRQTANIWLQDHFAGTVAHDGVAWRAHGDFAVPGVDTGAFLQSLLPETAENQGSNHLRSGELGRVEPFLSEPRRLMNFVLAPDSRPMTVTPSRNTIPAGGALSLHTDGRGVFMGRCEDDFLNTRAWSERLRADGLAPRLSGLQFKAAGFLRPDGRLSMVREVADPFTIIAKMDPAAAAGLTGIPVLEWVCQRAAGMAGLPTPEHALVVAVTGQAATLLSQRFDVPSDDDQSLTMALDGAALMGVSADKKYEVGTRALWRAMEKHSRDENRHAQAAAFFDRFALAWAMADGDLHAKNLSMIFRAERPGAAWDAALSPAYDTVCTRALDGFGNDRQALRIEGKDDGLNPKSWKRFGDFLGVPDGDARASRISAGLVAGFRAAATGVTDLFDGDYRAAVERLLDRATNAIEQRAFRVMGVSEADVSAAEAAHGEDAAIGEEPEEVRRRTAQSLNAGCGTEA